ncbi:hypothetical protein ACIQZD_12360 [Peribacillus sp. NPDC096447]
MRKKLDVFFIAEVCFQNMDRMVGQGMNSKVKFNNFQGGSKWKF